MQAGPSSKRQARARHRHELRILTYVTMDQVNGGIVRNLSHDGIAVQAVAAVRPRQQLGVRFDLRYPKLRVETRGEVVWSTFSGQCGIRFLDLTPRVARQIDEWIFGDLLEGFSVPWEQAGSLLLGSGDGSSAASNSGTSAATVGPPGVTALTLEAQEEDGLIVSAAQTKVIELPVPATAAAPESSSLVPAPPVDQLDWLFQPLSGRSLTWAINALVVLAALLLFVLIFLFITREAPRWPFAMVAGAAIMIAGLYWGFFKLLGGMSAGARLARLAGAEFEADGEDAARFR